jgi:hypothetical protein
VRRPLRAILDALKVRPATGSSTWAPTSAFSRFQLARLGAIVEAYEPHSASFEIGAALSKLYKTDVIFINRGLSAASLRYLRPRYRAICC